ncbi:unnamed protein product [Ostreobium quekettii]|uniref:Fungal lipase-type domain-containing protein n=1 Tax=Ostreobium quekettii TaxID=121088 RepID=A0A8S1JBH3_9CHLO|nr:unnamed protein product [Ostreobium quekettii]
MYHYDPEGGVQEKKGFSLEKGQELYGLTHIDSLVAKDTDTRVVISWNNAGTILVCFRGTSSKANVVADLKFWRTPHPPGRGLTMLSMIPMVHKGFLDSWTAKGFNHKLLEKIRSIMGSPEFDYPKLRILVSGHSLGGAIAVLAAHDIRRYCAVKPHQLSCYTFGCPRVGNHMFADEHNRVVPDTWHVINNLDPVPRMPKFWVLFKRSGRRVVINAHGDMIVQPIFLEFKLVSAFMGKTKVVHHWLSSYRRSLSSVVLAQFHTYKALPGGSEAMKELLQKGNITQVLGVNTGSANKLLTLASKIWMQRSHNMDLDNVGPDGKPIRVSQRSISGWLPSSLLRIGRRGSSSSSIDLSTELRRPGTSRKLTLREEGVSRSGLTNFAEELEEWEVQEMDAEMEDGEPNQPDREEAP